MKCYLVTGGAGFFGSIMKRILLNGGHRVVSIDLQSDDLAHSQVDLTRQSHLLMDEWRKEGFQQDDSEWWSSQDLLL